MRRGVEGRGRDGMGWGESVGVGGMVPTSGRGGW